MVVQPAPHREEDLPEELQLAQADPRDPQQLCGRQGLKGLQHLLAG
jgi:hypothetical protein